MTTKSNVGFWIGSWFKKRRLVQKLVKSKSSFHFG